MGWAGPQVNLGGEFRGWVHLRERTQLASSIVPAANNCYTNAGAPRMCAATTKPEPGCQDLCSDSFPRPKEAVLVMPLVSKGCNSGRAQET